MNVSKLYRTFQLTNEVEMIECKYHHLYSLIDIGNDHQWLTSQKKQQADKTCLLMEVIPPSVAYTCKINKYISIKFQQCRAMNPVGKFTI